MSRKALHQAVADDDVRACEELVEAGADVNATEDGWTPLHLAASRGSEACVSLLLDAGAYLDEEDSDEYETALHMAAVKGSEACVSLLLEAGARVDAVNSQDRTPLHWAAAEGSEACVSLLLKAGADVDAAEGNANETALHMTAKRGSAACVSLLVKAGADVNAINKYAEHPLLAAVSHAHVACVSLLLKAGADANAAASVDGKTPLCKAVEKWSVACVSLLLAAGADADATVECGWTAPTPLGHAIKHRRTAAVALLAAAVTHLQVHVSSELLQVSEEDQAALADKSHGGHSVAVERKKRRVATIAVLQDESRWRRRRPLALIREQRRAVRDAGLVHKEWEREQQEEAAAQRSSSEEGGC